MKKMKLQMESSPFLEGPSPCSVPQGHPGLSGGHREKQLGPCLLWKHWPRIVLRGGTTQACAHTGIGLGILRK